MTRRRAKARAEPAGQRSRSTSDDGMIVATGQPERPLQERGNAIRPEQGIVAMGNARAASEAIDPRCRAPGMAATMYLSVVLDGCEAPLNLRRHPRAELPFATDVAWGIMAP